VPTPAVGGASAGSISHRAMPEGIGFADIPPAPESAPGTGAAIPDLRQSPVPAYFRSLSNTSRMPARNTALASKTREEAAFA